MMFYIRQIVRNEVFNIRENLHIYVQHCLYTHMHSLIYTAATNIKSYVFLPFHCDWSMPPSLMFNLFCSCENVYRTANSVQELSQAYTYACA